ncbi:MAG: nucleoside triphosphate pyrophosphohydrolase [Chitinophagales bacterium]
MKPINLPAKLDAFNRILTIMEELREKCPWDKKQTIESLRPLTIEETYELTDAITEKNMVGIKEELGDLLLHIVFYAKIGEEQKAFDIESIINGLCDKLIKRHPHVYGDVEVKDEKEVQANWEILKLKEGRKSALEGVPKSLPALIKALRIQEKAKKVGFEWDTKEQVWEKVEEELGELKEAIEEKNQAHIEEEYGDVLFSLVNYARFIDVDPENALELTNKKFIKRFTQMEQIAQKQGNLLSDMTLQEMDAIWNEVKKKPSIEGGKETQ